MFLQNKKWLSSCTFFSVLKLHRSVLDLFRWILFLQRLLLLKRAFIERNRVIPWKFSWRNCLQSLSFGYLCFFLHLPLFFLPIYFFLSIYFLPILSVAEIPKAWEYHHIRQVIHPSHIIQNNLVVNYFMSESKWWITCIAAKKPADYGRGKQARIVRLGVSDPFACSIGIHSFRFGIDVRPTNDFTPGDRVRKKNILYSKKNTTSILLLSHVGHKFPDESD